MCYSSCKIYASVAKCLLWVLLIFIVGCSSDPKTLIVNRWKATSVHGTEQEKEKWEKRFEKKSYEFEFKDNGQCLMYEGGSLETEAKYTLATDNKSVLITQGNQSYTLQIISLSKEKMEAVTKGFMAPRDTIIYMAQ